MDSKAKFRWTVQASTDLLCRMSDEDVRLLAESGLDHMGFGTESASQNVLAMMNKKHQRVEDMFETARKTEQAGIRVTFNLILGYPGETEADRIETFRIMSELAGRHSNVSFSPNIFTPYPGIPIWPQLRQMGVREPQSLEEWETLPLGMNVLPWLAGGELDRLHRMLEFFLLNNQIRKATSSVPWLRHGVRKALGAPLRWRMRKSFYSFPWELWLARARKAGNPAVAPDGASTESQYAGSVLSGSRAVPLRRLHIGKRFADPFLSPLLRSEAGAQDAALPTLGHALCRSPAQKHGFSVALFDTMLENPERGFPAALAYHRPRIVAIYEDNFNFLSKMCLTRMRSVANGCSMPPPRRAPP